jgi:prepilin-type N-terminal cleavage/methylation domain-containing protein
MIFKALRFTNKNERGFTFLELLIVLAIGGIIAGAATSTTFQMITGSHRSSNHMTAVRQVQNVGYWISYDAQMAQSIVTADDVLTPEMEVLTMVWTGWEQTCGLNRCVDTYEIRYTYNGASDQIRRYRQITTSEYDDDGQLVNPQPVAQSSDTLIGDHITNINIEYSSDEKLDVDITASVGDAIEERIYEITPRPSI